MISDEIEFVLKPVSKTNNLPVFFTDFKIVLLSNGLTEIKSICSKSTLFSLKFCKDF